MFAAHRRKLLAAIADGVAVVAAAPETVRTGDTHHEYRQDSDFYYLTGFEEPEAIAVFSPRHPRHRFVLFVRPRDALAELWNGHRSGPEGARRRFGADAAYPIDAIDRWIGRYLSTASRVYALWGRHEVFDRRLNEWIRRTRPRQHTFERFDLAPVLAEMRLFKGTEELARMRRAVAATRRAHVAAMRAARPGLAENEIEGLLLYHYAALGCRSAYRPIVASGANATVLHYVRNDRRMREGELLLVDSGAESGCYACDVTRTFPVSGKFSPAQRVVYETVLEAQRAAIQECRPGVPQARFHEVAVEILTRGMVRMGLLKGRVRSLVRSGAYRRFYMHGTGHWLGLDVHDVGRYREGERPRRFAAGMVTTVEPGLYIARRQRGVDREFAGIGVRIEDDILVGRQGPVNLTEGIPKEIGEIEAIVGTAPCGAPLGA